MAFGSNDKQGFFGKMFDPDKQARSDLAMSRKEMAELRKTMLDIAKQTQKISAKDARDQAKLERLFNSLSKSGGKVANYESALLDAEERLRKQRQDIEKQIKAQTKLKNLGGKRGAAAEAKISELTGFLDSIKANEENSKAMLELFRKQQKIAEEKQRRAEKGWQGRMGEDFLKYGLDFIQGKNTAGLFFKNFANGFWQTSGGKDLLNGLKTIGTKFKDALENSAFGKRMKKFTEGFTSWTNKWLSQEKRKEYLEKAKSTVGAAGGMLGKAAGFLAAGFAAWKIGTMIGEWLNEQITEFLGMPLGEWIYHKVEEVKKFFGGIVDSVKNFFTAAKDTAVGMWNSVTGAFDAVTSYVTAIPDEFSKWWESFSLVDSITGAFESISNLVTEKMDAMGKKVGGFFGLDWGGIKAAGKAVVSAVAGAPGKVVDAAKSGAHKVASFLGGGNAHKEALVKQMDAMGMKDPKERAMFMAQTEHESGGFTRTSENLNYSSVANIRGAFKGNAALAKMSDAEVQKLVGNKEGLANVVYGNRMGNTEAGDGFKYRGRGVIQLTGKENYARAGKALNIDLVKNPDLAEQPEVAAKIAAWYWQDRGLGAKARAGDIAGVTKGIQGGSLGLSDRNERYEAYLAASGAASAPVAAAAPRAVSAGGAAPVTQAMPAVAMQASPPTPAPQSVSQSVPASNVTPNIDEIPMFVADSGVMMTNAVGAFT